MKLTAYWRHLLNQVNLNPTRIDTLNNRVGSVSSVLQGVNGYGTDVLAIIPQGSYAQRTIIKPVGIRDEFDADVLMQIEPQPGWDPKDYVADLYTKLRATAYREMVSRRTRCVVVDYANEFHVDVVPYLVTGGSQWITNRATNRWEETNPEGFNEWLDARDRIATRRLVEVIRLMKHLRDLKSTFTARSVVLSFLLADRVSATQTLIHPGCYNDLPTAFVRIIEDLDVWLQARPLRPNLPDPSCPAANFHERWTQEQYGNFRNQIHVYAAKARLAFDAATVEDSVRAWQGLFGPKFCKPPVEKKSLQLTEAATLVGPDEQDIENDWGFPRAINPTYRVRVEGSAMRKDDRRFGFVLAKHGNRIGKGRTVAFRVKDCNVPKPYDIYWKVRNEGEEAQRANCLRGEIKPGTDYHTESTLYSGGHFVEVYIVKDRRCVAIDRQRVTIA
jgi:hypothetical protein